MLSIFAFYGQHVFHTMYYNYGGGLTEVHYATPSRPFKGKKHNNKFVARSGEESISYATEIKQNTQDDHSAGTCADVNNSKTGPYMRAFEVGGGL